jgi:hypothetical protein
VAERQDVNILRDAVMGQAQRSLVRLRAFIDSRGYRAIGDHEEEYVKGPGMIFAGDPNTYLTIIRLRVDTGSGSTP